MIGPLVPPARRGIGKVTPQPPDKPLTPMMDIANLILNIAGVLLWINWIMTMSGPGLNRANTLLGTLRRAEPRGSGRWFFLAALPALITIRAWLYWEIGSTTAWVPTLNLGSISLAFRCDLFPRALAYSALSFTTALGLFYLALILLSALHRDPGDPDPFGRFVKLMLGPIARWNTQVRLILPVVGGALLWIGLSLLLTSMKLLPPPESELHRFEQAVLVGFFGYLTWTHLIAVILLLYLVNSYVHLGDHAIWDYIRSVGKTFLCPFRRLPLQIGRVDLSPLVALGVIYLVERGGDHLLVWLHRKLPL